MEQEIKPIENIPLTCRVYKCKYIPNWNKSTEPVVDYICAGNLEDCLEKLKGLLLGYNNFKILEITLVVDRVYLRGLARIDYLKSPRHD